MFKKKLLVFSSRPRVSSSQQRRATPCPTWHRITAPRRRWLTTGEWSTRRKLHTRKRSTWPPTRRKPPRHLLQQPVTRITKGNTKGTGVTWPGRACTTDPRHRWRTTGEWSTRRKSHTRRPRTWRPTRNRFRKSHISSHTRRHIGERVDEGIVEFFFFFFIGSVGIFSRDYLVVDDVV